ncbi:hypothetical protein AB0N07_42130 [Streptomyces sp. NPDC051172]|uniref:hypothetical protein n=1 Tax=Streptomyces sp. NPDC051172 TaxID=3155796 RepID=UPI00341557CD
MKRRTKAVIGTAPTASLLTGSTGVAEGKGRWPGSKEVSVMLPEGQTKPAIATEW